MEINRIILLIIFYIFIDVSKINHLWNENFHRRFLHHLQGTFFNPNKRPWIKFVKTKLDSNTIEYLNTIKIDKKDSIQSISPYLSKIFGGNYSKKSTLYFNDFDKETQKELEKIGNLMKPELEKMCGKKLYLGNSDFRCVLLRYEGADSQFTLHYDTEPHNCYRTLFLIKKQGNVPPFVYFDKNEQKYRKFLDVGEGIFFQGTKTYHGVESTGDENMKRYMVGWQYSTDNSIKDKSLCNQFRSASTFKIIKTLLPHILIPIILSLIFFKYVGGDFSENQKKYLVRITLFVILTALIHPFQKNELIGTGINFDLKVLITFTLICLFTILPPYYGIVYFNYIILTELFLPRYLLVDKVSGLYKN